MRQFLIFSLVLLIPIGCIRHYDDRVDAADVPGQGDTNLNDTEDSTVLEVASDTLEPPTDIPMDTPLDTPADTLTEVIDSDDAVDTKDVCVPDCVDKDCGDDGCGGSCGSCSGCESLCQDSLCVPEAQVDWGCHDGDIHWKDSCGAWGEFKKPCGEFGCTPGSQFCSGCEELCSGLECGPAGPDDACDCGTCTGAQEECVDGLCACQPACEGTECGDDGCGGSCGTCLEDDVCLDGSCCTPTCDGKECGDNGCGGSCGDCPGAQDECQAGTCVCVPECNDKQCGSDGCAGSCGECELASVCQGVLCVEIPPGSQCSDTVYDYKACWDFSYNVLVNGWYADSGSLQVDTEAGILICHEGQDGYNNGVDWLPTLNLPIVIETRCRIVAGGDGYLFPHLLGFFDGAADETFNVSCTKSGIYWNWGFIEWGGGTQYGPSQEGEWLNVKVAIGQLEGVLWAAMDGDDYQEIMTGTWPEATTLTKIRFEQPWDSHFECDYFQVYQ